MLSSSASSSSPLQRPRVSVLSPPAQSSHSSPASVEHSDPSKQRESSSQPRESSQMAHFLVELCVAVRYGGDFVCVGRPVSAACGALISIEGFDADHCDLRP